MFEKLAKNESGEGSVRSIFSFLVMLVFVLVAAFALRTYVIEPFLVPSASMERTIMTGDLVLSEKLSYNFGQPQRGDIVLFNDPHAYSRVLVKRVIALGGDVVDIQEGTLYVNGEVQSEDYVGGQLTEPETTLSGVDVEYPYTVPQGMVWVMGDNRGNSSDSRFFGPVNESEVFARAVLVYWPLNRICILN